MSLLPERRTLTREDLDAMPDDGHRYELIDGSLIVTPSPSLPHQVAVSQLLVVLQRSCPHHLIVLSAPLDVALADDTVVQPDVMVVARANCLAGDDLRPLLIVEALSPSTRQIDLTLKKARYEIAGTPHYWVVDPGVPSITTWTLVDGRYGEPETVTGTEVLTLSSPYAISISPVQLTL
ncbi:MAG: Uma2 family endonuclease [Propionibacteriales bacterium]|nr:Uma2 family endonuclease [Propionibacteriales bacterium]